MSTLSLVSLMTKSNTTFVGEKTAATFAYLCIVIIGLYVTSPHLGSV